MTNRIDTKGWRNGKHIFFFDNKSDGLAMYVQEDNPSRNEDAPLFNDLARFDLSIEEAERLVTQLKRRLKSIHSVRIDRL